VTVAENEITVELETLLMEKVNPGMPKKSKLRLSKYIISPDRLWTLSLISLLKSLNPTSSKNDGLPKKEGQYFIALLSGINPVNIY
jgi:hypothetical protein